MMDRVTMVAEERSGVGQEKARQIESLVWRLEEHRANEPMRLTR